MIKNQVTQKNDQQAWTRITENKEVKILEQSQNQPYQKQK